MSDNQKPAEVREFWISNHKIIIDQQMWPLVSLFKWHIHKNRNTFYVSTNIFINGKQSPLTMHRLMTGMRNVIVDHKNRNGLDNRRENLRFASARENAFNRVRFNKFGFRGIYQKKKESRLYSVQISVNGKKVHRHGFETIEEAARAYDLLSKELHGEFGIRNFED